jgi:hypothetical protein
MSEIDQIAFDFFYWFSRFEYALKENKYVRSGRNGTAEVDWKEFVNRHCDQYVLSEKAKGLFEAPPTRQIVGDDGTVSWTPLDLPKAGSELAQALLLVKTMRNNLFHGGKKGPKGWSDPYRMKELLSVGRGLLDEFASLAEIEADYLLP